MIELASRPRATTSAPSARRRSGASEGRVYSFVALGAARGEVTRSTVVSGLRPVAFGLAVGVGVALLAGRMLDAVLFGVRGHDPGSIAIASLVLVVIYPLMKRVTYWPQFFLGLAFNWGILVAWAAVTGGLGLPAALLYAAGIAWTLMAFLVLAPRMIQQDWFEQSITFYGMATAVTAIGLMLLRVVDPENRTTGAQAFAAQALVISPAKTSASALDSSFTFQCGCDKASADATLAQCTSKALAKSAKSKGRRSSSGRRNRHG